MTMMAGLPEILKVFWEVFMGELEKLNLAPKQEKLDQEWVELIKEALQLGLTREEIRDFLSNQQNNITCEKPA